MVKKIFWENFQLNHRSGKTLTYLCPHAPFARMITHEDSKEAVMGQKLDWYLQIVERFSPIVHESEGIIVGMGGFQRNTNRGNIQVIVGELTPFDPPWQIEN